MEGEMIARVTGRSDRRKRAHIGRDGLALLERNRQRVSRATNGGAHPASFESVRQILERPRVINVAMREQHGYPGRAFQGVQNGSNVVAETGAGVDYGRDVRPDDVRPSAVEGEGPGVVGQDDPDTCCHD